MRTIEIEKIERFIAHHQTALAWCVRDSGGLWEPAELVSEIALHLLTSVQGETVALDPDDASDAAELLKRLRASARRAAGGRARLVRPDQAGTGADWRPGDLRWESLPSDDGAHPLTLLETMEQSPPPNSRSIPITPNSVPGTRSQSALTRACGRWPAFC